MIDRHLRRLFNAEAPPPMIWEPQVYGRLYPDRPYFLTQVRKGISYLAPEIQAKFKEVGAQSYVCRRGSQAIHVSDLLKKQYEEANLSQKLSLRASLSANEAFVLFHENIMISPQSHLTGTIPALISGFMHRGVVKMTAHETGHIFDRVFSDDQTRLISGSDEYKTALQKDLDTMSKWSKNVLFLHVHGVQGLHTSLVSFRIETFAELFAETILDTPRLSKHMLHSANFVREHIDQEIDKYHKANSDFDPKTYPRMEIAVA